MTEERRVYSNNVADHGGTDGATSLTHPGYRAALLLHWFPLRMLFSAIHRPVKDFKLNCS